MKELLQAIQARITDNVTALKYVDEDWGQLDYYNNHPPVQWPCCLIDVGSVSWQNLSHKQQQGTATITISIATTKLTNTSSRAPATQREQAWAIHDVLQQVHQALHHYLPIPTCSMLYRKSSSRVRRDDGIQHYVLTYACTVIGNYINTTMVPGNTITAISVTPLLLG